MYSFATKNLCIRKKILKNGYSHMLVKKVSDKANKIIEKASFLEISEKNFKHRQDNSAFK